jgi:hypothetical protein
VRLFGASIYLLQLHRAKTMNLLYITVTNNILKKRKSLGSLKQKTEKNQLSNILIKTNYPTSKIQTFYENPNSVIRQPTRSLFSGW